jgi:hypothetical protein
VRKCRFCHEHIADVARVCPHCSAELIRRPPGPDADSFDETGALPALVNDHLRHVVLFLIVAVIYAIYLHRLLNGYLDGIVNGPEVDVFSDLLWPLAKLFVISGAPFAVMAFAHRDWESQDAAPVALAAWVAVFGFFSWNYGAGCPFGFALFFGPLVFSALAAHKIGGLHHRGRTASQRIVAHDGIW